MRQRNLGDALGSLMLHSYDMRARVEQRVSTDTTEGEWEESIANLLCTVQDQSARERQGTDAVYTHPVTHVAYCDEDADLSIGDRLVMTWRMVATRALWQRHGRRRWVAVTETERYLVLGKHRVQGLPEPHNQIQLDLWQMTPTR